MPWISEVEFIFSPGLYALFPHFRTIVEKMVKYEEKFDI